MPLLPEAKNCDVSVKKNFRKISRVLGYTGTPAWASIKLTDLLASRLIATDSGKVLESIADLTAWIIQSSANQVIVTDNGDGTVTLSLPQNIHLDATPEFAGIVIKDSGNYTIFYVDDDEMYFTAVPSAPITGNPMPWLFYFTYTV